MSRIKPYSREKVEQAANGLSHTLMISSQFIKDLSFENPRSLSLNPRGSQPNIEVNIETTANGVEDTTYEVVLTISAEAKQDNQVVFLVELSYGGIFTIPELPEHILGRSLLVECPRLLFPFARNIIADIVRDGGFPPLFLNPIDFDALYRRSQLGANEA